jgi:hypothetical protein
MNAIPLHAATSVNATAASATSVSATAASANTAGATAANATAANATTANATTANATTANATTASANAANANTAGATAHDRGGTLESIAFQAAAIMLAFAIPTLAALLLDDRQLHGVSVWDKPLKFEISLTIHLLTLGLLSRTLSVAVAGTRRIRAAYLVSALAAVGEIAYIVLQAARARESHFNVATHVEALMYKMMGLGATALVVCAFIIGLGIHRGGKPGVGGGISYGAAWGLMLGAVGTFITAGVMSAGLVDGPGHWVGGVHSDAHGLPLTGWSTTGGDLRVAHFCATHMMQTLPLIGWWADRWLPQRARLLGRAAAAVTAAIVVFTFIQAVRGRPLFPA